MRNTLAYLSLALLLLLQNACFEPKEGCLETGATNFDVNADENCDDCCTYPQWRLSVAQLYDGATFFENRNYLADNGKWFRLYSVAFYLSDFQAVKSGSALGISDTVQLRAFATGGAQDTVIETLTDDILLLRRVPTESALGTFRSDGNYSQIRFRVGLPEAARRVIPRLAPAGHPLRTQADSLWQGRERGYVYLRVVAARDTLPGTVPDTLSLLHSDLPDGVLVADGNFQHTTGYDFRLNVSIEYKKLFSGIDWTAGDISGWKVRIATNLPTAFSVSQ